VLGNYILRDGNSFGERTVIGTNDNQIFQIKTNNIARLTIATSGNIGIGTTAPSYKLDVVSATAISAKFDGRVIGVTAINSNELVTLGQLSASMSNSSLSISDTDNNPNITNVNKLIYPNNSIIASGSNTVEVNIFNGNRTVTRSGIPAVNVGTRNINEFLEEYFFPAVPPTLSLTNNGSSKQFGDGNPIILSWSVTKNTRGISAITVSGNFITVSNTINDDNDTYGAIQTGTISQSINININNTFNMQAKDTSNNIYNTTTTVTYYNKRYWGVISSYTAPSDSQIIAATGAGIGSGSEFATSYNKTYNGINGNGNYLFFAHPTSFGSSPTFTINGLPNTAFTKIRSNSAFINSNGYTASYDVWITNSAQNSPITMFTIS
jgi:hypothetical protein